MRGNLRALLYLSPWLAGFVIFFVYPLVSTAYFSFQRYDLFTLEPVGLLNWEYFFKDQAAWTAIRNTLWLVVVMVPLRVLFGLGVAQLVTRLKAGAGVYRTIFYLPALVPLVAGTLGFVFLLNPGTGPVDAILSAVGLPAPDWFGDPAWSKWGLTLLGLWSIGDVMVIFMAALLDVPKQLYEAAAIDGADGWRQFTSITLPVIRPVLMFALVTGVIQTLQYFTQAEVAARVASGATDSAGSVFTPGYPDQSTLTFPQWLFQQGFRDYAMGYACVLALVLFAVAMAFTLVLLRQFRFAEEES
ncbi:carbohydrate ABC transporter permease [Microbispora bryophytorum]|uniref:Sugar ABC transporter permease n=1 Tax=Microbispora bryophytorum TaxID=1460882 RepID=A0A8H9H3J3_9ACTN|nr:sugar ABC transporter permease [Microbispora bryophytorum]MBD3138366.1 sugar ABC transporter permease [Microbispora bryophytorum]TQS04188.1 sugar ABC transporter permease [Microbispora bryophytorum]GGO24720.1 sugar ABC transporter permease [Microbispora bryophytorum]